MRKTFTSIIAYAAVGLCINFLGFAIYCLITGVGVAPKITMTGLYVAGVVVSFFANKNLVFSYTGSSQRSWVRFIAAHVVGYSANFLLLFLFVDIGGYPHQYIQGGSIIIVADAFPAFKILCVPVRPAGKWCARDIASMRNFSVKLKKYTLPLVLPFFVWIVVVAWRPWGLGFYHDDWAILAPLRLNEIHGFFLEHASRPFYVLLVGGMRLVMNLNPYYYHLILAILFGCAAFSMGQLSRKIVQNLEVSNNTEKWVFSITASFWLSAPWCLGSTLWATTFPAHVSVIGFCVLGLLILNDDQLPRKLIKTSAAFGIVSLISELFWFSYIPLLIIYIGSLKSITLKNKISNAAKIFFCLSGVQVALGILNRGLSYYGIGVNRSFNEMALETISTSIILFPVEIIKPLLFPYLFNCLMVLFAVALFVGFAKSKSKSGFLCIVFGIMAGCVISIILFGLAGYRIESKGVFSRTMVVISLWLSFVPGFVFATAENFNRKYRNALAGLICTLLSLMIISNIASARGWIISWDFQERLFTMLPVDQFYSNGDANSFILIDATKPAGSVEALEAAWDSTAALSAISPSLKQLYTEGSNRLYATVLDKELKLTSWDGKVLKQAWCRTPDTPLWKFDVTSKVVFWENGTTDVIVHQEPFKLGCGLNWD